MDALNRLNKSALVAFINSLMIAGKLLRNAQKCKDTDPEKSKAYIEQAKRPIALLREIANGSDTPEEIIEKVDVLLGKYSDVINVVR